MGVICASRLAFWPRVTVTVSVVTGVVRTRTFWVSTIVLTRVTVLNKLVSRSGSSAISNLHDRSEFFHNRAVWIADTKNFAEVVAERAVVHKVIELILVADVLLAFEQPSEPTGTEQIENAIGRLGFIVSLLELAVRVWDTGKGEGAKKREAQGHCYEGLHG
jgi:hypothetical protein